VTRLIRTHSQLASFGTSALIVFAPDVELPTGKLTLGPGWVSYGGEF
jgi:hypothetical protein